MVSGCDDSGSFRCEAPMALGNMTTTLLVQCSPVFWEDGQVMKQFEVDLDQPTKLMFQIHAHTKDLSECWLFPWQKNHTAPLPPPSSTKGKENCLGFAETFGSPPNLTLSLRLNKVTWSNVGTWQLMISNKAGTGGVIFSVDLPATLSRPVWTTIVPLDQNASTTTRGPFFQPDPIDEGDEDESDSAAATAAVAAVLVIIVVIVVIVAVVVLKRHYGARVGRLFRIIWRRDVPEQPQQVSSIYCATEANTDRREGRRDEIRGGHLYRALYGPSPTPDNIYEDPENPENPPAYHC
ncbi:uncharacterized protein LOC143291634 [Babylonia areolata]|uniref:uncharacterized protein LOC143291634 n=1 Tax=Babylonia areolata TaxID=304850 RepID=UPI003FD63E5F